MTARAITRYASVLAILSAASLSALGAGANAEGFPALTKPSQDVTLSFVRPGRIVEMKVKEGDVVKKGELVARQDDSEESKMCDLYKSKAEDNTQIDAQKLIHEQSAKDYENIKNTGAGATSQYERDHAELQEKIDKAKIEIATLQHVQDGFQYEQYKAVEEKTKLFSPIDGVVEVLLVHQGESVDSQNMKVMQIVNIDPLWVEVPVPYAQAIQLKNGDAADVMLSNNEKRKGHVINVASVADSASDTLLVRVELPNADKRKAGERVTVTFPGIPPVASALQQP